MPTPDEKTNISFQVERETHSRVSALAQATGLSRSEFMRRAIDVTEKHLDEVRAMGEPAHPKSRWHH